MKRRMKGASWTAGDTGDSRVAVNVRVRVYPGTDGELGGTVVEDFGDLARHAVNIGENHIVGPAGWCNTWQRPSCMCALGPKCCFAHVVHLLQHRQFALYALLVAVAVRPLALVA